MKKISLGSATAVFLLFFLTFSLLVKGSDVTAGPAVVEDLDIGKQYFLFIALDNYAHWPGLDGAVSDVKRLKRVLQNYYHFDRIFELYDREATQGAILEKLKSLGKGGGNALAKNDSLLIYFSGHGEMIKEKDKAEGYWIPYDGTKKGSTGAGGNWVGNNQIQKLIENIKADHILIVSDSCFSGSLVGTFRGDSREESKKLLRTIYPYTARKVMTSGAKEPVPSRSVFAKHLIDKLELAAMPVRVGNKTSQQKLFVKLSSIYVEVEDAVAKYTVGKKARGNRSMYGDLRGFTTDFNSRFFLFTKAGYKHIIIPARKKRTDAFPGTARFFMNEGIKYFNEGKLDDALKYLKKAKTKEPKLVKARYALGALYFKKKAYPLAKEQFEKAIKLDPQYYEAYNYLGMIGIKQDRHDYAFEKLLFAAEAKDNPVREYAFYNLVLLELERGRLDIALGYGKKGLKENESFLQLNSLLGLVCENSRRYDLAIHYYQKFREGQVRGEKGEKDEAAAVALINLGRVHSRLGEKGVAKKKFQEALALTDNPGQIKTIHALMEKIN